MLHAWLGALGSLGGVDKNLAHVGCEMTFEKVLLQYCSVYMDLSEPAAFDAEDRAQKGDQMGSFIMLARQTGMVMPFMGYQKQTI